MFWKEERAQAATEYMLLIALGLVIVVVGVAIAFQIKNFTDVISNRIITERSSTIGMLLR